MFAMNFVKPAFSRATLIVLAMACSGPLVEVAANAETATRDRCAGEIAILQSMAVHVRITAAVPNGMSVGDTYEVTWHAAERFPQKQPVYAVVAVDGDFRIQPPPSQNPRDTGQQYFDLPGIVALPKDARGPLGIAFGARRSRVFVPLYQPGSKLDGQFAVRPFTTGTLSVSIGLVARTGCGERLLRPLDERTVKVHPGPPVIVVQDPYDTETPQRVIVSNSG